MTQSRAWLSWPALPYELWQSTCDTLHAHTQVLGNLVGAVAFDPRPQEVSWSVPLDEDDEHAT